MGRPIWPEATRSRRRAVLSSKRKTCATPSNTSALRAASTICLHSQAFIPIGFSQSTGLPWAIAIITSDRCSAFGVATNTASTSGDRHRSATESNARGILYCAADSRAAAMSRRESAVTWQPRASANPGISLRTACKPNPAIP